MNSRQDFLQDLATRQERKRKSYRFMQLLYNLIVRTLIILSMLALVVLLVLVFFNPLLILALAGGAVVLALLLAVPRPSDLYREFVKKKIIPRIFEELYPAYAYNPYSGNREMLEQSSIFSKKFMEETQTLYLEDQVSGKVGEVEVEFFETWFYDETWDLRVMLPLMILGLLLLPLIIFFAISRGVGLDLDFNDFIVKRTVDKYKGLFMYADFHKDFKGQLVMLPKNFEGNTPINFKRMGYRRVELEDSDIAKNYVIYSTEEQMAYYLISPRFMKSVVDVFTYENAKPAISLQNGKMFMTIPWEKDYFSTKLKEKVKGPEHYSKYLDEMDSFGKIIKHFDLETRLWTKR